jgi:hypothetical protein
VLVIEHLFGSAAVQYRQLAAMFANLVEAGHESGLVSPLAKTLRPFSSRAVHTSVIDSPAILASSLARRWVASFLMFRLIPASEG